MKTIPLSIPTIPVKVMAAKSVSKTEWVITRLMYPFVMAVSVILFLLFQNEGSNYVMSTYVPLLFSSILIFLAEKFYPYDLAWKPEQADWKNDSLFFVFIQSLLSKLMVWVSIHYLLIWMHVWYPEWHQIWPHDWPVAGQLILVILI